MNELCRLVGFELRRVFHGIRLAPWVGLVALASQDACARTFQLAGSLQAPWNSLSILDPFYVGLNDASIAGMLIPSACCVLCADIFSKDISNAYLKLIVCKVHRQRSVWIAKIIATLLACFATISLYYLISLLFAALAGMGIPEATAAAWMRSPGIDLTTFGPLCPVPATWNYPLLTLALIPFYSLIVFEVTFLFQSLLAKSPSPKAPILLSIGLLFLFGSIPYIANSFGLMFDLPELLAPTGWITDRLCLSSYRFDAGFFQTTAGSLAAGPHIPIGDPQSLSFPINSWASLCLLCAAAFSISLLLVIRLSRREGVVLSSQR